MRALLLIQKLFRRKRAHRELEKRKRLHRVKQRQHEHMMEKIQARNMAFDTLNHGATRIQALVRGRKERRYLQLLGKAASSFQKAVRGHLGRMRSRLVALLSGKELDPLITHKQHI